MELKQKVEDHISSQTNRVEEALELTDMKKVTPKQDGNLTKASVDYLNEVIESLGEDEAKTYTLLVGSLGSYKKGDKVPASEIGVDYIEKYKKNGIIE